MDVKTICLGLLSFDEACGYELKKTFEAQFGHFFPAGYGSIYPALADLAEASLVTCTEIPQEGKPDRKVYRITETGRQAFLDALYSAEPQHKMRSEFLAMMYFAELMDSERLGELLDQRIRKLRDTVEQIEANDTGKARTTSAGARFVDGFSAVVAAAAAEYVEANRHLFTDSDSEETRKVAAGG